jgi:transposase InsO family protein
MSLHSRRLAGWSIADHMRTELVTDALEAAARTRGGSLDGAIFHSDNGAQYASKEFAKVCSRLGVIRSRGAVGTSADNAAAESFNATLKRETLSTLRGKPPRWVRCCADYPGCASLSRSRRSASSATPWSAG